MIKVSDFIAKFLAQNGIRHVFMITGGGSMHLNQSLGSHSQLQVIFNHHEQGCAMAAESYARLTGRLAAVNVTSGPGGINALNGVFGAWTDSIPMLILSGQVKYQTTVNHSELNLRQLGDQEADIIASVKPMTKFAEMVSDPKLIKYYLQKALSLALSGRHGPVWLDIPLNVQGAMVDEERLVEYTPQLHRTVRPTSRRQVREVLKKIERAERPVVLVGSGVRLAQAHGEFLQLIDVLNIPVVTAWNAHDALHDDHPLYIGRPGSLGDRPGNFAVQNADLLIVLGSRLNIRQIGYNYETFAREAFKVIVDIDPLELIKPTIQADLPIQADLADFMQVMMSEIGQTTLPRKTDWYEWCKRKQSEYPVVLKKYWELKELINPYCFMQMLSEQLKENQIIVTSNGSACVMSFQAMRIKRGQRLYTNSGSASMGYELPAAIGASVAREGESIICLAGDGSIMQNIQELAQIAYYNLPIKIFVLNNQGYHSIRQTQGTFFGDKFVGVDEKSGVGLPDFNKLASAFNLSYFSLKSHEEMRDGIDAVLKTEGPALCEVFLTIDQPFAPKLSSKKLADGRMVSRPLEDLAPFLDRKELKENMLIKTVEE